MRKEKIALRVIYALAIYVLLQLLWWGYQLVQLHAQIIRQQNLGAEDHNQILRLKVWMIVGEGLVFFVLLAIGFRYIQRMVTRELAITRKEKNFLLSVTHELKTPIAAVKLFLETLQARSLSEEKRSELLQLSVQETKRLQSLTENILLAARLDSNVDAFSSAVVNLSALVSKEVERFRRLHSSSIVMNLEEEIFIKGDEQMLSVLLTNLIDNALKYAPEGIVEVGLNNTIPCIELRVSDNGQGIPTGEETRIFDKFYRIGNEETRSSKGTGLGLFIVRAVAKMHRAEVRATNLATGGALFIVRFKK